MKTLVEINEIAGGSDLSHWNIIESFTLIEAALLCAGNDPSQVESIYAAERADLPTAKFAKVFLRSLHDAIVSGTMEPIRAYAYYGDEGEWRQITSDEIEIDTHLSDHTLIARKALMQWADRKGLLKRRQVAPSLSPPLKPSPSVATKEETLLLESTYTTPALELQSEFIKHHWALYDPEEPDTAIDKSICLAWLMERTKELGLSANVAKSIDLLARHPNAKAGNRVKRVGTQDKE